MKSKRFLTENIKGGGETRLVPESPGVSQKSFFFKIAKSELGFIQRSDPSYIYNDNKLFAYATNSHSEVLNGTWGPLVVFLVK